MKKILFSLFIFILAPLSALAINYDIKNYYIEANIKENGDVDVQELLVLKGTFNGYERDIKYKSNTNSLYNASDITDVKIFAKTYEGNVSFASLKENYEEFTEVSYATNGDKTSYIVTPITNGYRYRMYYATNKSTTAFLIEYTLKDAAILHNDCAELYWNFIGNEFEDDINDLNIRVNLPGKMDSDDLHWWFHGDLSGTSKLYETNTTTGVVAHLDKNKSYEAVDNRILFAKTLLNEEEVTKKDNNNVLESIIKVEDERVAQDNAERERIHNLYYTAVYMTIGYFVILIITWIYVYLKYDKERKPEFQNDYNRDFIEDYNVEVIDYLMNKKVSPNAMSASIMNLIYKKNISYEKIEETKKEHYRFTLLNKDNLSASEIKLVNFLFEKVGKENEFTTVDLKQYSSNPVTCTTFMNSYTSWNNQVVEEAKDQEFFDKGLGKAKFGIIIFLLAIIIDIFAGVYNIEFAPISFVLLSAVIFIIYLCFATKKTEKGIEHYARWKAFKKFLEDFGEFSIKELPEIELWERYLVYATVFGLADKVEKVMNVKIQEIEPAMMGTYAYLPHNIHMAHVIDSSIRSAYNGAHTAIVGSNSSINRTGANSSPGSFGGHGGGFSSGGGFGGGGGGGRGF